MIIFFGLMPKVFFFQLPNLKQYCLWDPSGSFVPGDKKKLKIDHLWLDLRAVSHSMLQWLQNVIKKTEGAYQY